MISNEIKTIAESSDTSKAIFEVLKDRKRFRRYTNLSQFNQVLLNKGYKVVEDEYFDTFKALEKAGAGSLIIGRKGNPNRFIWDYNLKDVAKAASGEEVKPQVIKRGPGRPPKVTTVLKVDEKPKTIKLTININTEDLLKEFRAELLELAKKAV